MDNAITIVVSTNFHSFKFINLKNITINTNKPKKHKTPKGSNIGNNTHSHPKSGHTVIFKTKRTANIKKKLNLIVIFYSSNNPNMLEVQN